MGSSPTENRITKTPIVPALDGFRAYAIAGVVLIHVLIVSGVVVRTQGSLANTAIWGLLGNVIDAFFIISGFVLFLPIVVRRGDIGGLGRFARGRAARLLPGYWLCLSLALALVLVVPPVAALGSPSALEILANFSALQMPVGLFEPVAIGFGIDGPLWMISVIVGLYFVLPLVARPYLRHPLLGLALAALITVGWKELALHSGLFESIAPAGTASWAARLTAINQLPGWLFSFALGMTGACAYLRARERWPEEILARWALQALPAALVAYIAFAYLYGKTGETVSGAITGSVARTDTFGSLGSSLSRAALMAVIVVGPVWLQRPFANGITSRGAELSLGVYLVHFIVIVYAGRYLELSTDGGARTLVLWLLVVVPVSLLYALASGRLVERPARDWARRRERRGSAPGGLVAPGVFEPRVSGRKPPVPGSEPAAAYQSRSRS
jgi:peptidoglycan/LPS O-acetylase OafA/YrhL